MRLSPEPLLMRLTAYENWGKLTPVVSYAPCPKVALELDWARKVPVATYSVPASRSRPTPLTSERMIDVPTCVAPDTWKRSWTVPLISIRSHVQALKKVAPNPLLVTVVTGAA